MKNGSLLLLLLLPFVTSCGGGPDHSPSTTEAAAREDLDCNDPPAGPGALAPRLVATPEALLLSWLEPIDPAMPDVHRFLLAELISDTWNEPVEIAASSAFFANWADLPGVVEDVDGERFAHWLEKLGEGTYAYGAPLVRATAPGEWESLGLLHDDDSPTEHGFVSYVPLAAPGGGVQAFWLDGRAMPQGGAMHLRTARIDSGGPGPSTLLDDRACECCPTDAALTVAGPIVAYRDRDLDEKRDIAIIRATAEGWSEPRTVHEDRWEIHGCPVNGPAIAADGQRVAVAWWTGAEPPRVQVAFSDDAGEAFAPPIVIDDDGPLGRVDVVLDSHGRAIVSWMASTEAAGEAEIRWRRVGEDGRMSKPRVLARTSAQRSAGFPKLAQRDEELFLAWVEVADVTTEAVSRLRVCQGPLG